MTSLSLRSGGVVRRVGVRVSEDVLDLVDQALLVRSTGSLEVLVLNAGGGALSAGQTGPAWVVVSRILGVSTGKVVAVTGSEGVVIGLLVVDVVAVVTSSGRGSVNVESVSTGRTAGETAVTTKVVVRDGDSWAVDTRSRSPRQTRSSSSRAGQPRSSSLGVRAGQARSG